MVFWGIGISRYFEFRWGYEFVFIGGSVVFDYVRFYYERLLYRD